MPTSPAIRDSLLRAIDVFEQKPAAAHGEDSPARVVWTGGLATRLLPEKPAVLQTDMPATLGGGETAPTPGWFFRAGVAACMTTTIAMHAALRGIALKRLEVVAHSETDARGLLFVGTEVPSGPQRVWLDVTLEADASDDAIAGLLAVADAHAPMSGALRRPLDVTLRRAAAVAA